MVSMSLKSVHWYDALEIDAHKGMMRNSNWYIIENLSNHGKKIWYSEGISNEIALKVSKLQRSYVYFEEKRSKKYLIKSANFSL